MNYYCLIAGLPDISPDDNHPPFGIVPFREEVYPQLSHNDRLPIDLFYRKFDNLNLLRYLKNKDAPFDSRGMLDKEELEACLRLAGESDRPDNPYFPPYYHDFVEAYRQQGSDETAHWENRLAESYYRQAMNCNNGVVSRWFAFNLNLNNVLSAHATRKYGMETDAVGDNEVAQAVRTSAQRDMGLTGVLDELDDWLRIADESDCFEREKKIDLLKWKWLDEATFFKYFSIESIFAWLVKLDIIERWSMLDAAEGGKIFRELTEKLKNDAVNKNVK
ncbi:MAG: DUF2764 domain-containing protein [Bacteroidales bacterium]|jgi:hypothetical protein|nr:DUF2764 domain-containing protein [Bacteroidales bacterium]